MAAVVYRAMLHDLAQPAEPMPISGNPSLLDESGAPTDPRSSGLLAPSWPSSTTIGPKGRRYLGLEVLGQSQTVTTISSEENTGELILRAITA